MSLPINIKQFSVSEAYSQCLVVLTNKLFNKIDIILVAPVQVQIKQ